MCYLICYLARRDQLAPASPTPALRKEREGQGTPSIGDASEIKSLITRRTVTPPTATMPVGGFMSKSRRQFLTQTSLGLLAAASACRGYAQQPADLPPGAPPAFGAG